MSDVVNGTWELSRAHEEHYFEKRAHVVKLLRAWGSTTNSRWPEFARFVSITEVHVTPAWFGRIVEIGKQSIMRTIPGWKLAELYPQRTWREWSHDVFFIEAALGNVNKGKHAPGLWAYIPADDYVRVIALGCDHPNATHKRGGQSFVEYECPDCLYSWGVDTSD